MNRIDKQLLGLVGFMVLVTPCVTSNADTPLPQPDYHQDRDDPKWLSTAVQFHGHLGPWAVAGIRLGAAGREAVKAQGYFDVDVVCEGPFSKPPKRCFLDGVQVATGATWGKGNIRMVKSSEITVTVTNKRTGKRVTVGPTRSLLGMLAGIAAKSGVKPDHERLEKPDHERLEKLDHERLEKLARKIAKMPASEILAFEAAPAKPKD